MSEHELWNELGNLYFMTGAYKQASHAYNRSIQLENRYGRPYSNLAFAYVQQGKFTEAIELYRSSIELLTDDREKAISWFRLGDVYRRLKDYRDAILAYQQADQLDPSLSQDETEADKVLYGASDLTSSPLQAPGEASKFEPVTTETVAPDPVIPEPIVADAPPLEAVQNEPAVTDPIDTGQPQEIEPEPMITFLEEAGAEAEANPPALSAEIEEFLPEFAEEDITGADQATLEEWMVGADAEIPDETLTEWMSNLQSETEPAVTFPATSENYPGTNYSAPAPSLSSDPGQTTYSDRKDLMVVEVQQPLTAFILAPQEEEQTKALETAEKITEETPQAVPTTQAIEQPAIESEIEGLRRLLQNEPANASAWDDLGELYKSLRFYKDAIPAYQKAVENDPKNVQYLYHLGCACAIEGFAEDAVKTFQQIIKLDSSHALAHATLGGYYRKMGLEELAQKHIGKAVKNFIDSENDYNHACLQALSGNVDTAIDLLRTALQTEQTYVDWVLRDPDLDSIRTDPRFKQLISDFS